MVAPPCLTGDDGGDAGAPPTVLHDELMFIRVLQIFETLTDRFGQLVRAREAMAARKVGGAHPLVGANARRCPRRYAG